MNNFIFNHVNLILSLFLFFPLFYSLLILPISYSWNMNAKINSSTKLVTIIFLIIQIIIGIASYLIYYQSSKALFSQTNILQYILQISSQTFALYVVSFVIGTLELIVAIPIVMSILPMKIIIKSNLILLSYGSILACVIIFIFKYISYKDYTKSYIIELVILLIYIYLLPYLGANLAYKKYFKDIFVSKNIFKIFQKKIAFFSLTILALICFALNKNNSMYIIMITSIGLIDSYVISLFNSYKQNYLVL